MSDSTVTVTLMDVAQRAGVSKMTVSNVINNKPGMSPATRERVQRAIEETGYVVNAAARVLAGGRMNLLGVITPRINWPFVTEILHGASSVAEAAGLDLAIFTTADNPRLERERATLLRTLADGVLLIIPAADEHQVFGTTPVVTIAGDGPYTISVDDEQGGRLAAQHLLHLGHTRIAHIRGAITPSRHDAHDREHGFRQALHAAGLTLPPELVRNGEFTEAGGEQAAHELLSLPEPPTAIFAANDRSAVGALHAAQALGLRVPHDLSIVGYDDVQAATLARPALTTVRQPLVDMGEQAAHTLITLTRGLSPAEPHTRFPATLIVRDSTAPPRRSP